MQLPSHTEVTEIMIKAADYSPRVADWGRRLEAAREDDEMDRVWSERKAFSTSDAIDAANFVSRMSGALHLMAQIALLNSDEVVGSRGGADEVTMLDDALARWQGLPPTIDQVAMAHADVQFALLSAVRERIGSDLTPDELEQLVRIYNEIPPVNLPDDPPFGEFQQEWKPEGQ